MEAREYLSEVQKKDLIVENTLFELEQVEALATSVTQHLSDVKVQTSGNPDKMSDIVQKIIEKRNEYNEAVDDFVDYRDEVVENIKQLNATEYDLLHKVYIQYMTLKDFALASRKKMSYSNVTTLHGRALDKLQKILDKKSL